MFFANGGVYQYENKEKTEKKKKGPGKKAESCLTCFEHQRKIEAVTIVLTVMTSTMVVRL